MDVSALSTPPLPQNEAEKRAVEYGADLTLIDECLRLTPLERMKKN
jgi:hypothetical protein